MIAKTGLLVLTNPKNISHILPTIQKQVKNTLYIHLTGALKPLNRVRPEIYSTIPKCSQTIRVIYSEAVRHCKDLDVRVLLSSLKYSSPMSNINTSRQIEIVIFDKLFDKPDVDLFLKTYVKNLKEECSVITLDDKQSQGVIEPNENDSNKTYDHVVLGGTFDRLHVGHKMLLSEAMLRSTKKVTVGVADANMLLGKTLWELIEPCSTRIQSVNEFVQDIFPDLQYDIVRIEDPLGPTRTCKDMDMLVVSAETIKGGNKVNEVRVENDLKVLDIHAVELVDCPDREQDEEKKISSSTFRMRLLGTLLKNVDNKYKPNSPYIIGLTGGIAAGKSSISNRLVNLGAGHIDCDKVAHELYKSGRPCFQAIRKEFGEKVVGEDGEINRKILGGIVFGNKEQMTKLNSLVWPLIANEVQIKTQKLFDEGCKVVVVEAAVLHQAGWHNMCNEVWGCIIPPEEAISRLKARNGLTEEEAKARLSMQISNKEHVQNANVVLCTLWSYSYTQRTVERAWELLNLRLK